MPQQQHYNGQTLPRRCAAGAFFAAELALGFHVGFVASHAGRKREVLSGQHVASYYIRHGSFFQDLLSTAIWAAQVRRRGLGGGAGGPQAMAGGRGACFVAAFAGGRASSALP